MNKCPKCGAALNACVPCYLFPAVIGSDGSVQLQHADERHIETEPWEHNPEQFYLFCDGEVNHYFYWNDGGWEYKSSD